MNKTKVALVACSVAIVLVLGLLIGLFVYAGQHNKNSQYDKNTTEKTESEIKAEVVDDKDTQDTEVPTTTEQEKETEEATTEVVTADIYEQENSYTHNSKEIDRNQVLTAIERFCREQNPDLNNMSQDEYYFYWDLTEETEQEYVITYRSYTGSFTYFHVNRGTGNVTTMEYVPGITDGEVPGAEEFQIWDYIE